MAVFSRDDRLRIGVVLFVVFVSVSIATVALAQTSARPSPGTASLPCRDGGPRCINIGFTDAWFGGGTVQLEYSHRFFCAEASEKSGSSECEAGEAAQTHPPSGPGVSNVYLLIPVEFSPPESTLHCPVRGPGIHPPPTIDVSRLVGSRGEDAILPAHSLVIEDAEA